MFSKAAVGIRKRRASLGMAGRALALSESSLLPVTSVPEPVLSALPSLLSPSTQPLELASLPLPPGNSLSSPCSGHHPTYSQTTYIDSPRLEQSFLPSHHTPSSPSPATTASFPPSSRTLHTPLDARQPPPPSPTTKMSEWSDRDRDAITAGDAAADSTAFTNFWAKVPQG